MEDVVLEVIKGLINSGRLSVACVLSDTQDGNIRSLSTKSCIFTLDGEILDSSEQ